MKKFISASLVCITLLFSGSVIAQSAATNTAQTQTVGSTSQALGGALEYDPVTNSTVKYPASTAIAPALTASAPCMGSSSVGGGSSMFSFSMGTTWSDEDCKLVKDSSQLWNMGQYRAAVVMVCTNDHYRYAISMAGGIQIPGPTKGSYYMVGCPMTEKEWIAAGRPVIDIITNQPAKLNILVTPIEPVVVQPILTVATTNRASQAELRAIQLDAKQKYGINLVVQ